MDPRLEWNQRYQQGSHANLEPDPFLLSVYERFVQPQYPGAGAAIELAGGIGRHSLWLAQRGWDVTLVDISDTAAALARARAAAAGVSLNAVVADLTRFVIVNRYALVLAFNYLERPLFPALAAALAPGGFLVYKSFTTEAPRLGKAPRDPRYLLEPGELRQAFSHLEILHYREEASERGTAELLARRQ
jgi:tellurite methyltransferase